MTPGYLVIQEYTFIFTALLYSQHLQRYKQQQLLKIANHPTGIIQCDMLTRIISLMLSFPERENKHEN